jgi:3-oxoacyl-ACP reductase-like protein
MSIFSFIKEKIFGYAAPAAAAPATPAPPTATATTARPTAAAAASSAGSATVAAAPVDVEAVLARMAHSAGDQSNWQSSIVDLLKLLGHDSSLTARKELAEELNVHAGEHGSAEQNIALYKAVMTHLEGSGATVSLKLKH